MKLNSVPQQTHTSGSRAESDQYPYTFSSGMASSLPTMRPHVLHPDVVIVSIKYGPTSWFAPAEINEKNHQFLIDSEASKSVISKEVYDGLPEPKPPIQHTDVRFQIANGSVKRAAGVCHLPVQLRFENIVKSLYLPGGQLLCKSTKKACHVGLYEFLKMPYSFTNAAPIFQCLMEKVLQGYIGKRCLLYLDNVIVFGDTFKEALDNLMAILYRLKEYNLKLKAKKCSFFQRKVNFLGHIVYENGIECDPVKIEKIKDLLPPETKTGLGNYY